MRILPDNPSLDFLRKEAKDLLGALRELRPAASLAEAQRALAVQYGMRSWEQLRSEVERRKASLPTAPPGLAAELAGAFGLGNVTAPLAPVAFTPMGRCWCVTTERGRWLAMTVYEWITEEQALVGERLRDAAVAGGVAAPAPVRSPGGRLIEPVRGEPWRVHEWLELGPTPVTPTPSGVARTIGAIFGTLHSLALPSSTAVSPYLTYRRPEADWDALLGRARAAGSPWAGRLAEVMPALLDARSIETVVPDTEVILCNCNLIPEHVRMGHDDALVVSEWHFAGSLTPALEIGSALTHWTLGPSVNPAALRAFVDGYADTAGRFPVLDLSSFSVAVAGWLNWAYNTMCEAIDPRGADRASFAERETLDLLAHPLVRPVLEELCETTQELSLTG